MYKIKFALVRVVLWLSSFVIADLCFSLFFGIYSLEISISATCFIFTLIFAVPAWCLYLPVVIAFKDAEGRKIWAILSGGILIGPLSLLLWGAVESRTMRWDSVKGFATFLIFAVIVGSLTTCAYVYCLKILHRRRNAANILSWFKKRLSNRSKTAIRN